MKKLTLLYAILCMSCAYAQAQNHEEIISSMDALGYSDDNSAMLKMDICSFLQKADHIFIGYDSLSTGIVVKKAIIDAEASAVVQVFVLSVPLKSSHDVPYADYISYVDHQGLVHEILNIPKNALILKEFSLSLFMGGCAFESIE